MDHLKDRAAAADDMAIVSLGAAILGCTIQISGAIHGQTGVRMSAVQPTGKVMQNLERLGKRRHGREHHEEDRDGRDWQANETPELIGTSHNRLLHRCDKQLNRRAYGVISHTVP